MEDSSPCYRDKIEALCVESPVYDIIIGNVKGARPPQDHDASWSPPQTDKPGTAEEGRATKITRMAPTRPLKSTSMIDVDKTEFLEAQKTDVPLLTYGKRSKMQRQRYRSNGDEKSPRTGSHVVVPKCRRNGVMKLAQQCNGWSPGD